MTEERREIARRYIFDMINSFVEDPETGSYPHLESTPPSVSFYSPDFENLLRWICEHDIYSVKHLDLELLDFGHSNKYDIDGHCVHPLDGTIYIRIDGVAFDQSEIDEFLRGYKKALEEEAVSNASKVTVGSQRKPVFIPPKFHVQLPK